MLRNYFLINLVLIILLSFLGLKLYRTYRATAGIPSPSEIRQKKEKDVIKRRAPFLNEASYNVIAQKDLFRPSRSAPEKQDEKTSDKTGPTNPPKLFGTIILDNEKTVILQDSESKVTKVYKLNDLIAGYTIAEIHEEKVVLLKDAERHEIKLRADKGISPPKPKAVQQRRPKRVPQKSQTQPSQRRRPRRVRRNVPPPETAPK